MRQKRAAAPGQCSTGYAFYVCNNAASHFTGCCSIDPCGNGSQGGCPDVSDTSDSSSSASARVSPTTTNESAAASSLEIQTSAHENQQQSPLPSATGSSQPEDLTPDVSSSQTVSVYTVLTTQEIVNQEVAETSKDGVSSIGQAESVTTTALLTFTTDRKPTSLTASSSAPASTTSTIEHSPPQSNTHTAVIAGSVGACVGALVALVLILALVKWRRRREREKNRKTQHGDDPRLQGIDANRAGESFKSEDDGKCSRVFTRLQDLALTILLQPRHT